MSMNETLSFLNSLHAFGWKLGLANISDLLEKIGNPHQMFKSIHIAGTNGKGSTAAILESILRQAGYRTGLYTSPHLAEVTERIKIDGKPVEFEQFSHSLMGMQNAIQAIGNTYFEAVTAVGFQCFAEAEVDVAIIEVGLGGRFDATNVITPVLSIITEIDLEHTEHLGKTRTAIAFEKAGIIKERVPCLVQSDESEVTDVFQSVCADKQAALSRLSEITSLRNIKITEEFSQFELSSSQGQFDHLRLALVGTHQIRNAALAIAATNLLQPHFEIEREHIYAGLAKVVWPGRLHKVQEDPRIVVDVAHNPAAIRQLVRTVPEVYDYDRLVLVVGMLKDKDTRHAADSLATIADHIIVVSPKTERALPAHELAKQFRNYSGGLKVCPGVNRGVAHAKSFAGKRDLILITGSHYVVGEFLESKQKS